MIVISAFVEDAMLNPDVIDHADNPFDGIDIIKVIPQGENDSNAMVEAQTFVNDWMEEHPGHKVCIDTHPVTI